MSYYSLGGPPPVRRLTIGTTVAALRSASSVVALEATGWTITAGLCLCLVAGVAVVALVLAIMVWRENRHHADDATGDEKETFEIQWRWKEEVIYWEGPNGYCFDGGWGSDPPTLYVPSVAIWDQVVPVWLQGRRDEIIARLVAKSGHVLQDTDRNYTPASAAGRAETRIGSSMRGEVANSDEDL